MFLCCRAAVLLPSFSSSLEPSSPLASFLVFLSLFVSLEPSSSIGFVTRRRDRYDRRDDYRERDRYERDRYERDYRRDDRYERDYRRDDRY